VRAHCRKYRDNVWDRKSKLPNAIHGGMAAGGLLYPLIKKYRRTPVAVKARVTSYYQTMIGKAPLEPAPPASVEGAADTLSDLQPSPLASPTAATPNA